MAFTMINGMRSARYPLQGMRSGCGCAGRGIGQTPTTTQQAAAATTSPVLIGTMALALGFVGWWMLSGSPKKNSRHRR